MRALASIAGLALLGLAGCETYELPPRLLGVGTEDCPQCKDLVLSETRVPPGQGVVISAEFAFEDEWGSLSELTVFVTNPSGEVLQGEREGDGGQGTSEPGFVCQFQSELDEDVGNGACKFTTPSSQANLQGVQKSVLLSVFEIDLDQTGQWTVEYEATRSTGTPSNRLSATFEVAEDVLDDTDGDRVDPGDTDTN